MKGLKEDRRIKITKMAIKESLIELMQSNPISKISVKTICEAADINRSTFYAHYCDQYDLLNQLQREIMSDIKAHVFSVRFMEQSGEAISVIIQVLEYVKARSPLFKALLSGNGDVTFQNEVMYMAQEKMLEEIREDSRLDGRVAKYIELFSISGVLSIVYKWLEDGCVDDTAVLAKMISGLLMMGISSFYQ